MRVAPDASAQFLRYARLWSRRAVADVRSTVQYARAGDRRADGPAAGDVEECDERGASFAPHASLPVVAVANGLRSDQDLTRGLIEHIVSGELGAKLRSQVASWHPGVSRDDVDEAFQEACLLAERSCRGQSEGEVFTWLRTTTHRELGHMQRQSRSRSRHELLTDVAAADFQFAAIEGQLPEEVLIDREDRAELERITQSVLARLSERQRQIAALHSHGRRRPEIARHLGMTPRSVKRALEHIMAEGRDELVRLAGRGCESGEPLVARLAFGLASPGEMRRAQLHLTTCPACGALYERLDLWREKVAVLLPVPIAEQAHPGVVERALHGAADALSNVKHRTSEGAGVAREQLADGTAHAKQHAAATYYRVVDPTPLAGVRPGAAAAAIAGCLAVGGGATYCVERGVDPMRAFSGVVATKQQEQKPPKKRRAAVTAVATPTVTATPTPQPSPEPTPSPASTPAPTPTPQPQATPEPPPAPQDEYEPVSPVAGAQAAQASSTPSKPAPAPADGPGEFDGP